MVVTQADRSPTRMARDAKSPIGLPRGALRWLPCSQAQIETRMCTLVYQCSFTIALASCCAGLAASLSACNIDPGRYWRDNRRSWAHQSTRCPMLYLKTSSLYCSSHLQVSLSDPSIGDKFSVEKLNASGRRLVSVPSIVHGAPETAEVSLMSVVHACRSSNSLQLHAAAQSMPAA